MENGGRMIFINDDAVKLKNNSQPSFIFKEYEIKHILAFDLAE